MWKNYEPSAEIKAEDYSKEELVEEKSAAKKSKKPSKKQAKRYVAVTGITLDKLNARFRPGDEIPLEVLEHPDVAFDWLLNKGAIKEIGSE